jgi:hypothetical protein
MISCSWSSLLPEVAFRFLRFADDYVILQPLSADHFRCARAIQDLSQIPIRGDTPWKAQPRRTFDLLKQYGYPGYNFEAHVLQRLDKKLVFETFMAFRQFTSENRYNGIVAYRNDRFG